MIMKAISFCLLILLGFSCSTSNEAEMDLNAADAAAVSGMLQETNNLKHTAANLTSATTSPERHHWDSIYHHHDSVYWHHHNTYNTANHHPHNDHHHQWVPYDHVVDHSHHYHPPYPGHPHDSLVVIPNGHHSNHNTSHSSAHNLHDHHVMDSLHHIHQSYHH